MIDLMFLAEPDFFYAFRDILDLGGVYADQKIIDFKEYMKIKGYWPDIKEIS